MDSESITKLNQRIGHLRSSMQIAIVSIVLLCVAQMIQLYGHNSPFYPYSFTIVMIVLIGALVTMCSLQTAGPIRLGTG